jgi:hypothetical protein
MLRIVLYLFLLIPTIYCLQVKSYYNFDVVVNDYFLDSVSNVNGYMRNGGTSSTVGKFSNSYQSGNTENSFVDLGLFSFLLLSRLNFKF